MLRSVGTCRATSVMRSANVIAASRRRRLDNPGFDDRPLRMAETTAEESLWRTRRHYKTSVVLGVGEGDENDT